MIRRCGRRWKCSGSFRPSLYDDRLEIDSPGMLYDGLSVSEALSGKSRCRNTAIAEAFQYMKYIEAWGTGLPRLFRSCREMGLPEPVFEEFGDGMKVTIFRRANSEDVRTKFGRSSEEVRKKFGEASEQIDQSKLDGVNIPQKRILVLLTGQPEMTGTAIAEELNISRRGIEKNIKLLKEKGLLVRHGSTKNGFWEVVE